jgi:hypothetical protein
MSDQVASRDSKCAGSDAVNAAEVTLRLLARLPAPQGLENRIDARLRAALRRAPVKAWPLSLAGEWMRAAAAAAIVCVVAGGGWGIFLRVHPGQAAPGISGPSLAAPGGFTEGGAVRRPQTLTGPRVTATPATSTALKPKARPRSSATVPARGASLPAGKLASPAHPSVTQ